MAQIIPEGRTRAKSFTPDEGSFLNQMEKGAGNYGEEGGIGIDTGREAKQRAGNGCNAARPGPKPGNSSMGGDVRDRCRQSGNLSPAE